MGRYETPEYDVIEKEGNFEIRDYSDFYIVEYANAHDPNMNNGFGTLFNYISKGNKQHEKINMTVPVIMESTETGSKMAFILPKDNWQNIPEPNDDRLRVQPFQKGRFACIQYSGSWSSQKEQENTQKLREWLKSKNLTPQSTMMMAVYNGPYVPAVFRRNEILVRISNGSTE